MRNGRGKNRLFGDSPNKPTARVSVRIKGRILAETDEAMLFDSPDLNDQQEGEWLPINHIQSVHRHASFTEVVITDWLARKLKLL